MPTQGPQPGNDRRSGDLISVIVPVRNGERFIERTLESVLAQTYSNIEVIVVDDGSTDGTLKIVKEVASRDRRVAFFSGPQAGVAAARNCALSHAQGDFIAPVDADDLWHREKLALQLAAIRQGGANVGVAYCWSVMIDETDNIFSPTVHRFVFGGNVVAPLVEQCFLGNASTPLIRRHCLEAVGGYDPALKAQGAEDWKLYLALADICEFVPVPRCLVGYRKSAASMSANVVAMQQSSNDVGDWARNKWPRLPRKHWRRQRYFGNHYLANIALQRRSFREAAMFHWHSIVAWPVSLTYMSTAKFSVRLLAQLVGIDLPSIRRSPMTFQQFSERFNTALLTPEHGKC